MDHNVIPAKGSPDYTDYVIALAKGPSLKEGVINEPRMFFDVFAPIPPTGGAAQGIPTAGTPGAFVNGEQFPIRLTHLTAATRYLQSDNVTSDDPRNIQRIGLNLVYHDQFYMNPQFLPLPVWGNKVVAAADVVSFATSAWSFVENSRPFLLSARDTLMVQVRLDVAANPNPGSEIPVNVTFTGFGALSKRPYILNSQILMNKANFAMPMTSDDFRNDGVEPIVITDMTVNVGAALDASDATGDISQVSINVRHVGNGTNATLFNGPAALSWCPAQLLGLTTGRAVVHEFPGDGLIWEPNEGITVFAEALGSATFASVLCLGLGGYLMIP